MASANDRYGDEDGLGAGSNVALRKNLGLVYMHAVRSGERDVNAGVADVLDVFVKVGCEDLVEPVRLEGCASQRWSDVWSELLAMEGASITPT